MRSHTIPTHNRSCEDEEYATISMAELENKMQNLDAAGQEIVSLFNRGFAPDAIAQTSG